MVEDLDMRFVNYHEVTDGQSVNTQLGHQSAERRVPRREREDERAAQLHSKTRWGDASTARAHEKRRRRESKFERYQEQPGSNA